MCCNLQRVTTMLFSKLSNSFMFNSLKYKFPKNKDNSTNGSQASFGSNPFMTRGTKNFVINYFVLMSLNIFCNLLDYNF